MKGSSFERAIETAVICERGLVRAENQDAVFCESACGVFAVADGMGGGQGGARASALVVEAFRSELESGADFPERVESVRRAISSANMSIRAYAREEGYRQTGSTVAALLAGDAIPGSALIAWIGDSRIYCLRAGHLRLLTRDHTVANELMGSSASRDGSYDRSLPYAHVLTRALGAERSVEEDWRQCEIQLGDRILLCSDGVHDMLPPETIRTILSAAPSAKAAATNLSKAVTAAGAHDNFSAVLVFTREGAH